MPGFSAGDAAGVEPGDSPCESLALFERWLLVCERGCEVCCGSLNARRIERKNRSNGPGSFVSAETIVATANKIDIVASVARKIRFTLLN